MDLLQENQNLQEELQRLAAKVKCMLDYGLSIHEHHHIRNTGIYIVYTVGKINIIAWKTFEG